MIKLAAENLFNTEILEHNIITRREPDVHFESPEDLSKRYR